MMSDYIIITPAYNEEEFIEKTIQSVIAQTVTPLAWIIVDDGSTDRTSQIIKRYSDAYAWMKCICRRRVPGETYYGSNVHAILLGLKEVQALDYQHIAILDADIELCGNYYEEVLHRFETFPNLGIACGTYLEREGDQFVEARIDRMSTPKAIQVFRRECYERTGGYIPFRHGGEDTGMEILARMSGWNTWSFNEIQVVHLRPVGLRDRRSILRARFGLGFRDYCMATHPMFMLAKAIRRAFWEKPLLLSGVARLAGYIYGICRQESRQLPKDAQRYIRKEQVLRLLHCIGVGRKSWTPSV
jgi:poly-beta-1,6-N-acetyl-D-glucosamine synthase